MANTRKAQEQAQAQAQAQESAQAQEQEQAQAQTDKPTATVPTEEQARVEFQLVADENKKLADKNFTLEESALDFGISIDTKAITASRTVGSGEKATVQKCMVVPSYDGKKAYQIDTPEAIEGYQRVAYLRTLQKVTGFAIPCELHRIAVNKAFKVGSDIDTIQKYAKVFFGYSSTTTNQYIRIVEYFLEYGTDEDGKAFYRVKEPFDFHSSLTMGHFVELLAYITYEKGKDGAPDILWDINEFYAELIANGITFNCSTSVLRKQLSEKFGKTAPVKNVKGKEEDGNGSGDGNGDGNGGGNGDGNGDGNGTIETAELALIEVRTAIDTISKKATVYADIFTDADRVQSLVVELMKLIKPMEQTQENAQAEQTE